MEKRYRADGGCSQEKIYRTPVEFYSLSSIVGEEDIEEQELTEAKDLVQPGQVPPVLQGRVRDDSPPPPAKRRRVRSQTSSDSSPADSRLRSGLFYSIFTMFLQSFTLFLQCFYRGLHCFYSVTTGFKSILTVFGILLLQCIDNIPK